MSQNQDKIHQTFGIQISTAEHSIQRTAFHILHLAQNPSGSLSAALGKKGTLRVLNTRELVNKSKDSG